ARAPLGVVAGGRDLGTGVDHAFHYRVEPVASLSVGLRRDVECQRVSSDEAAFGRRLDRNLIELLGRVASPEVATRHDIAVGDRSSFGLHHALTRRASFW